MSGGQGQPDRGEGVLPAVHMERLRRDLANTVRLGKVVETDYANARARVQVDDMVSTWVPWTVRRAGGNRVWEAPEVGEQVLVTCPSGRLEQAVIVGSVYQNDYPPNGQDDGAAQSGEIVRETFGDGTSVTFDRANSRYTIDIPAGGEFIVRVGQSELKITDGEVFLTTPKFTGARP